MSEITQRLAEPFDPAVVSWRVGPVNQAKTKGMALAYIDARDVMRRLDDVCGPENWQDDYPWSDGKRVVCRIGIRIGDEWVWKTDGAGDTDTEGEKGALSDAFKRAAVKWAIGRYLYDTKSPWVEIEPKGKSYVIKDSEFARLANTLPRPNRAPATVLSARPPSAVTPSAQTPFDGPPQYRTNLSSLPAHPEEPPEATAERAHIKGLISKYQGIIKTAPSKAVLKQSFEDGLKELGEIAAASEEEAADLRDLYMRRVDAFNESKAA